MRRGASGGGSWFFLGELFVDVPLEADVREPVADGCGRCSACIRAPCSMSASPNTVHRAAPLIWKSSAQMACFISKAEKFAPPCD